MKRSFGAVGKNDLYGKAQQINLMESALNGAIEANRSMIGKDNSLRSHRRAEASIQRRGTHMAGDVSPNYGLNNTGNGFEFGLGGDFRGSRESGGVSSPFGGLGGLGGGFAGLGGHGQGSRTALTQNTRVAHQKMAAVVSAYKGFGIIKNVVDLMANFASEGLRIKHPSKAVQKFYKRWAEHVGLQERVNAILRYYYKYSNVFIYTTNGVIDEKTHQKMKRAKASVLGQVEDFNRITGDSNDPFREERLEQEEEEKEKPESEREIPWRYQLLNPFQMNLVGTKYFGESKWVFLLDPETAADINSDKLKTRQNISFLDQTEMNLPAEFRNLIGKTKDPRVVDLDSTKLTTLFYMKDDHEDWADPMIWPVMNDIYFKNKLRQMDISVCNSVINSITVFKLGDWKGGFVPPPEQFKEFAEMLRTPTAAMTMVWNDAIDVIDSTPPTDKILGHAKYESVDKDILRGLGIPDVLVGGNSSGNFSSGFLGVRTLLERLEEGRNAVLTWLNGELRKIANIMGHRDIPIVRFGKMSLRDEKAEKQLILGLLDRNIISIEAVLEAFDEDFGIELQRLKEEKVISEKEGIFVKHGPYTDPMATMTDDEVMDREEEQADKQADRIMKERQATVRVQNKQSRQGTKPGVNGRPPGTKGIPQERRRETKPKGMAWLIDYEKNKSEAHKIIAEVEKTIAEQVLDVRGKKYKKALALEDKKAIEDFTFAAASWLNFAQSVSKETVREVLAYHGKMNNKIYSSYKKFLPPNATLSDRKEAMASAMATQRTTDE